MRRREGKREEESEGVPDAVEVVAGDVGEYEDCKKAVRNVDKIIFCAAARTVFTGDLLRVEQNGVSNLAKAMQVGYRVACRHGVQKGTCRQVEKMCNNWQGSKAKATAIVYEQQPETCCCAKANSLTGHSNVNALFNPYLVGWKWRRLKHIISVSLVCVLRVG